MEGRRGSMSYYSILGLSPDCTGEEIRRAYRKLAMVSAQSSEIWIPSNETCMDMGWNWVA